MIALVASSFPWPGDQNPQHGHYYLSIPSRSCYCAPIIWVLAPHGRAEELGIHPHFDETPVGSEQAFPSAPLQLEAPRPLLSPPVFRSAPPTAAARLASRNARPVLLARDIAMRAT